jgi:hypothetical protein
MMYELRVVVIMYYQVHTEDIMDLHLRIECWFGQSIMDCPQCNITTTTTTTTTTAAAASADVGATGEGNASTSTVWKTV